MIHFEASFYTPLTIILSVLIAISIVVVIVKGDAAKGGLMALFFRILGLLALFAVALHPFYESTSESSKATLLLDISDSFDSGAADELLTKARERYKNIDVSVIPFSGTSGSTRLKLGDTGTFKAIRDAWGKLDIGKTDIERGLQSISADPPSSVLLISDGFETRGDGAQAAAQLAAGGFKVFPLVFDEVSREGDSFRISQLYVPLVAPANKSVDVRVSLRNTTSKPQSGALVVAHDKHEIYRESVSVQPGKESLVLAQSDPSKEGIKEITATFKPDDKEFPVSQETMYLSGETREKILLLSGTAEDERFLKQMLTEQSYQLKAEIAESGRLSLPKLTDYSVVIFNNIAINQLESGSPTKIDEYVKGGGGFIMIGGNKSFGLGGYLASAIEDVLPVQILPPHTEQKRLNVAVELVLDKSRSMSFDNKIEFVKEAAREVIRNLKDDDLVGVIGFDATPFIVVRLAQLADIRDQALDRVGRLFAFGKTNLIPAIDEARRSLERANAGRKHMIILTDGKIPDSGPFYIELTKQLRLVGITMSTVMLGDEIDIGMLKEMAQVGGGAFYQTTDANSLPRIFLSDIKVSSGEKSLKEQNEYDVRKGPSDIHSTTISSFPPLKGYVETKRKDSAALELVTYNGETAEPLLASWDYGQGRSLAFTSDANGRWSSFWAGWPRFVQFWTEVVDSVRPKKGAQNKNIRFDLRYFVEHGSLMVDLALFAEQAPSRVSMTLKQPDGSFAKVPLRSVSSGRYVGEASNAKAGVYEVSTQVDGTDLTPVSFALSGELFGEQKGKGFNLPFLQRLASETGGKLNPNASELQKEVYKRTEKTSLTPWALLLALLLILFEILYREVFDKVWHRQKALTSRRFA